MKRCRFNQAAFAQALKFERGQRTFREIADELKIAHTTLHRFELQQKKPSIDNFATICSWLKLSMDTFIDHA